MGERLSFFCHGKENEGDKDRLGNIILTTVQKRGLQKRVHSEKKCLKEDDISFEQGVLSLRPKWGMKNGV